MRVTAAQRLRTSIRAEAEIQRYAGDHMLWHKHVHNVELDPIQLLKCVEMDEHPNTIDFSCRRTGKTAVKELHALKEIATRPHQTEGIVAPRLQQAQTNLTYHTDAIRRSEILRAYIYWKSGREQLSDTSYQFANKSGAEAYGIMSQIDGDSLTIASLEETDDMPEDRLFSRFLPMLGSARRLGVSREVAFKPQVRITGVFKGAATLQTLIDSGVYHPLPIVNVYLGMQMGLLNEQFMLDMRAQLPPHEYLRQFLCKNVAATNHIHELYIRKAMTVGIRARLERAGPVPGGRYKKRGLVSFGYDHTGHGENPQASKSALVVTEQIGNYTVFIYVQTWKAGVDDKVIERDLCGFWEYFRPDFAIGDAYGVGMLTSLNDRLFAAGLTDIDRRTIGDGQSTGSTWLEWPFAPLRFEGMVKHQMAGALRSVFHNSQAAIPYFQDADEAMHGAARPGNVLQLPSLASLDDSDWSLLVRQLANIKAVPTKVSYSSYQMAIKALGDDLFDAAMAAVWALVTRGALEVPTLIESRTQTRAQLLGRAA